MPPNLPDDFDQIPRWHFAVGGLDSVQEVFELGGAIRLCRLRQFPTHEDLVESLGFERLTVAAAMAQYGEQVIRHELVIDAERFQERPERIFPTAEAILAGLRIRTQAEIVCPAVSEFSWAVLDKCGPPIGCLAFHMERGVSYHAAAKPKMLLADDLDWVRDNLATVVRLTESDDFQTAVEALCTYMLAANDRMKVAQLWAGIEAIFGIEYELRYRLATLTARLLCEPGKECRAVYNDMKKLYGQRNKIIHGRPLADTREKHDRIVAQHIVRVRGRLAQLLTKLIALGMVPSEKDLEELLFGKENPDSSAP